MYRSGFVPRRLAILGLVGGPLIILSGIGVLFDLFPQAKRCRRLPPIPEFIWELSLGIYPLVKGFKPCAIFPADGRVESAPAVAQ